MRNSVKKLIVDSIMQAFTLLIEAGIIYLIINLLTTDKRRIIAKDLINDFNIKILDLINKVEEKEKEEKEKEEQQNKEA